VGATASRRLHRSGGAAFWSRRDHPSTLAAPSAGAVSHFEAVTAGEAHRDHGDKSSRHSELGRDGVRADEAITSPHDFPDPWPHRYHGAATLPLRANDGKANLSTLSTAVHRCPVIHPCHAESLRLAHYNGHLVCRRGRIPGVSPQRK